MSKREALVAVLVAFCVGVIGSLSLTAGSRINHGSPNRFQGSIDAGLSSAPLIRWRVTSAFGTHLPALGENAVQVADRLRAATGGQIDWTVDDPGEVVPAFSIVDAVRAGKIEAGYTWLGYDEGRLASSVLFGAVPFGMTPWEYSAWWWSAGGRELAQSIYRPLGVETILCGIIGPETAGWFRNEINRPEDLNGLKIRFAGLGGRVLQKLGAAVTMMPGGEIFQALEKGAIDATEFSLPEVDLLLGFSRIATYNYFPGWHQPHTAFHLVVHQATWNDLAPESRAMIEMACGDGVYRNLANAEAAQGPVIAGFAETGVKTRVLSPELMDALERATAEVLAEAESADADFARVLAHQRAFRADYAIWRDLAYPAQTDLAGSLPSKIDLPNDADAFEAQSDGR